MDGNKEFRKENLEKVTGGDLGEEIKPDGGSDLPDGKTTGPNGFSVIKCPNCGKEDNLVYLGQTGEGHHFRCPTCQTEFTH